MITVTGEFYAVCLSKQALKATLVPVNDFKNRRH